LAGDRESEDIALLISDEQRVIVNKTDGFTLFAAAEAQSARR
jgi:hypothetical protein